MAGPRVPLEILEARGAKHLTAAERAERARSEIRNSETIKRLTPPAWLPEGQRAEFSRISSTLLKLMPGMMARTDADIIATYCMARMEYLAATRQANAALAAGNAKNAMEWGKVQKRYFDQARACANDLGMTVTSRCRLVLPEGTNKPQESEFERLMRDKRERMQRA